MSICFCTNGIAINRTAVCFFFPVKCYLPREVDLFTQLLASMAVGSVKLANICHKTARSLQSMLSLTLMK